MRNLLYARHKYFHRVMLHRKKVNKELKGCTIDGCQVYSTLALAIAACETMDYCGGVTKIGTDYFTRYSVILSYKVSAESWLRY